MMMMSTAKKIGRSTSARVVDHRLDFIIVIEGFTRVSGTFGDVADDVSIITTEPSTINPKSMAPRLIRLPDTPA